MVVCLSLILLFCFLNKLNGGVDIALEEVTPCQVLVDLIVGVIMVQSCFIGSLSLSQIFVLFVEEAYFKERVNLTLNCEGVS